MSNNQNCVSKNEESNSVDFSNFLWFVCLRCVPSSEMDLRGDGCTYVEVYLEV
jgi:hypothetical protein